MDRRPDFERCTIHKGFMFPVRVLGQA